jgi:malonyl-CoA O-methyltransferase
MVDAAAIKQSFGRAAHHYDQHSHLQRMVREQCLELASSFWPKDSRILDAGCGTGAMAREAREAGYGWQVFGFDLSFGMCAVNSAPVVNASANDLPFADATFDGVFSSLMLQWLADPLPCLREMHRVLRPNGFCLLSTFIKGTLQELSDAFAALDNVRHINEFAEPSSLTALAAHAGFRLLEAEEETITARYPDTLSLIRSLKDIGASVKQENTRKGLMTPRQFHRLDQEYRRRYGDKKGLPSSWQVLYLLMEKP